MNTSNESGRHPLRRRRAKSNGVRLSAANAAIVKGMLDRGDRQSDIAAYFKVNSGRISEIATGVKHASVLPAPSE